MLFRGANFLLGNPNALAREIQVVQFYRPGKECSITAFPDVGNNLGGHGLGFVILLGTASKQPLFNSRCEVDDAHHNTILFRGYSTIPWALAVFSFGKICRTTASSMMVLTATQSGSLRAEIVGFFSAGRTARTAGRSSRWTLRSSPTLLAAAIAPCSMRIKFSAFSRFQEPAAEARFMINTVADSSTLSRMRRRFAPVFIMNREIGRAHV